MQRAAASAAAAAKATKSKATQADLAAIMHPQKQQREAPAAEDDVPMKLKLGRPVGVVEKQKRCKRSNAEIVIADAEGHGSEGSEKRARVSCGIFVSETGRRDRASEQHDPGRAHTSKECALLPGDIETKLKGIALDDVSAIAEFALLLLSPASGSGDSIDSAVSKFCASDSQAAEIEDLRGQLRAKDDLLAQRTDHIMELEAKLDDGQLGAITTRYPPAARDIYLTNPRHAQATR